MNSKIGKVPTIKLMMFVCWGLGFRIETGDWGLETRDWKLETGDWKLETGNWGLGTGDWEFKRWDRAGK
jgi:hypothetical protein